MPIFIRESHQHSPAPPKKKLCDELIFPTILSKSGVAETSWSKVEQLPDSLGSSGGRLLSPACGWLGTSLPQYGFRCLNSLSPATPLVRAQSLQLYYRSAQEAASHESQRLMDFCPTKNSSSGKLSGPAFLSVLEEKQVISNWSCRKPVQGSCKAGVFNPAYCFIFSHPQMLFFIPAAS